MFSQKIVNVCHSLLQCVTKVLNLVIFMVTNCTIDNDTRQNDSLKSK